MDSSEACLDRIEAQRSTGDTETVPEFCTNIRLSDLFDIPGEYVPMSPEIFSAVSAWEKGWLEKLISYGKPMACLKSDQGDSVLHLAAAWGHLELVKSIVSECPCLLLETDSRDQLPLHVAARSGHRAVVEALVEAVTFVLAKVSEEERESLNLYVLQDINGDTPLHLALKDRNVRIAICLVMADQKASFLANKDGISPLYLVIEDGSVSLVREMLKTNIYRFEWMRPNIGSRLEERKGLVHAALKARNTDILDVILKDCPRLEDERDEKGMTCLSYGASIGFYKGVCNLLDRSTKNVYVCDDDGCFPIHTAAKNGHIRTVKKILQCCPDSKHQLNKQGQNFFHVAAKNGEHGTFFRSFWNRSMSTNKVISNLMEKQDMDGNTPLHLATINWHPNTLSSIQLLNRDERIVRTRNNNGLTALDIAETNLQPNYIFRERLTLMVLLYQSRKRITKRSDPPPGDKIKEYVNTLLVVAALVATVTFAAGFTIPGGFNSSGPNMGSAASDPKLVFFMVFDILAMQSSILTIVTLIWAQLGDPALVHRYLDVAFPSLFFALICMPIAFYCGVYVAFAHVKGIVIFLNVTSAFFLYILLFVFGPHVFLHIPHVFLHIPGIPSILGFYYVFFVTLFDEKVKPGKTSGKDLMQKKEST